MTNEGSNAHAHIHREAAVGSGHRAGGGVVTRASVDLGHMWYNAKGSPSTQGSCNPHHAPSTEKGQVCYQLYCASGNTTQRASSDAQMNGWSGPTGHAVTFAENVNV